MNSIPENEAFRGIRAGSSAEKALKMRTSSGSGASLPNSSRGSTVILSGSNWDSRNSGQCSPEFEDCLKTISQSVNRIVQIREEVDQMLDGFRHQYFRSASQQIDQQMINSTPNNSTNDHFSLTSLSSTISLDEEETDDQLDEGKDQLSDLPEVEFSNSSNSFMRMSTFQEERLTRMKDINVVFHHGLPEEMYKAIGRSLCGVLEIKRRHLKLKFYRDCFLGSDCIMELVMRGFAHNDMQAMQIGAMLIKLGYVESASKSQSNSQVENSPNCFYRFTPVLEFVEEVDNLRMTGTNGLDPNFRESVISDSFSPNERFSEASDEVHALICNESLKVIAKCLKMELEKKNQLLYYQRHVGCFVGVHAVHYLRKLRIVTTVIDALFIGQALLDERIITCVSDANHHVFQNRHIFYRFANIG